MFESILGVDEYSKEVITPEEKFNNTLQASAKCRFIASDRLRHLAVITSHTTTILSLIMILIPLLQIAGVKFQTTTELLTAIQIFLAICILIYSVINTQARYAIRAEKLNVCSKKIQQLQRELYADIQGGKEFDLSVYRKMYDEIEIDSENHAMSDYYFAKLRLNRIYKVTKLRRLYVWVNAVKCSAFAYVDMLILSALVYCIGKELLTGSSPISILATIG